MDSFVTSTPNRAIYSKGEYVLIFLQPQNNNYRTFALAQGKFTVENVDGIKMLKRNSNIGRLAFLDPATDKSDFKIEFTCNEIVATINKNK